MTIPSSSTPGAVDIYRYPALDTLIASPVTARDASWHPLKNASGSGVFTISADDPDAGDIQVNDVAVFHNDDGTSVASMICQEAFEHTLDPREGGGQVITWRGPLTGGALGWMLVEPAGGDQRLPIEEDAVFDWRGHYYDPANDSWAAATEIVSVDDAADSEEGAADGDWPHQPMAGTVRTSGNGSGGFDRLSGGVSPPAQMIAESGATTTLADKGWRLYRYPITVSADDAGRWGIELIMDNWGYFWVDGIQHLHVRPEDGFISATFKAWDMSAGDHLLTFAVFNFEDEENPGEGQGPAALAFNLYKCDNMNQPLPDSPYLVSDSTVEVLYTDEDPWPGMTVGEIVLDLLGIYHARPSSEAWLTATFDATEDSLGNAWERVPGITTKTGTTSYEALLGELVASGRLGMWEVEWDAQTFNLRAPGVTTRPTTVDFPDGIELTPAPALNPNTGELVLLDRRVT